MTVELTSIDHYEITGRGTLYIVRNPYLWNSTEDIVGASVILDGVPGTIRGVETCAIKMGKEHTAQKHDHLRILFKPDEDLKNA